MKGFAYLLKLEADQNHNRYYRMVQEGDRFKIEMGRIGARPVCMVRPMTLWDTTYQKKIKEGYEDRSEFCDVSVEKNQNYKPIPDFVVAELMEYLQKEANQILEKSYTISWTDVNKHMLKDAQSLINQIGGSVESCNQILLKLFVVIPRKMQDVQEMLAHTHKEIPEIIQREQDLLDVLRFKCKQNAQNGKIASPSETILDMLGITIRECTYGENQQILKHLGKESQKYFKRAFRVQNIQTERRFYEWMSENGYTKKDIHCYFHGSKNQNYLGLLSEGPLLNPDAPITGKMFGYGIYLAPRAKKSINYTDISGSVWAKGKKHRAYLAVYKTAYNNAKDIYTWTSSMTGYRASNIFPNDAVFAHKGSSLINKGGFKYALHKENIRFITDRLYRFNNWMQCDPIWHRGSSKTHVSEKYGRYSKRYCKK